MKVISYGVLVLNDDEEILLCHVTGQSHWDIPKGGADDGEKPTAAAVRELKEETGLVLDEEELLDLGVFQYNKKKDLHLFTVKNRVMVSLDALKCTSFFVDERSGTEHPEVDNFSWFKLEDVPSVTAKSMANLLPDVLRGVLNKKAAPSKAKKM